MSKPKPVEVGPVLILLRNTISGIVGGLIYAYGPDMVRAELKRLADGDEFWEVIKEAAPTVISNSVDAADQAQKNLQKRRKSGVS